MILTGQMERDNALQLLQEPSFDESTIANEIEFVASKLEITLEELNSFMLLPKKSYKDYKNQMHIYDFGRRIMRVMGLELGGKR
jgi:hypothetical protein